MSLADPVRLLEEHLREAGRSQADFAREIQTNHTMVGRILTRARRPGVKIASAIEHATGGKVPARLWGDWYRQVDGRELKRKAS